MSIAKRGRLYHHRRRVPRRYQSIELHETFWISLHTDSETIARGKADRAWSQMMEAWEARLDGNSADAEARYEAAREPARHYRSCGPSRHCPGTPHHCHQGTGTVLDARQGEDPRQERGSVAPLGGAAQEGGEELRRGHGNKEIANITRDDMLDFRQHWLDRIEAGEVTANPANKDLIHLGDVLKTVNTMKRLRCSSARDAPCLQTNFAQLSRRRGYITAEKESVLATLRTAAFRSSVVVEQVQIVWE